jgi:hypothetical protein
MKRVKQLAAIFFLIASGTFLFSKSASAQSSSDSLKNSYSEKLIGIWLGRNELKEMHGSSGETVTFTYDTLKISKDNTYYLSRGSNVEKHWSPMISSGTCEVNLKPVTYIQFREKYNSRNLSLSEYVITITKLTETEFSFLFDDQSYVYKRMK